MAELQRTRKTATTLIDALQRRGYLPLTIDTLLLRAQLHAALDDAASTKADICAAVELAEPEGFISIFLENRKFVQERLVECLAQDPVCLHSAFIRQFLAAFTRLLPPAEIPEHPVVQIGLVELLTAREIEVLGLIGQGLTYNQIAAQLVVSLNTVRTHVKSIYGKLGVDNRTAAVKMAHRHHIL
jgi:LuxR family maltose regulon positive regulatory protein